MTREPAVDGRSVVLRLELRNFRCHRRLRLDLDAGPVVLTGGNGCGKTSVLEAISLLAPGRGLRRARLADVLRRDDVTAPAWSIAARLDGPAGPTDVVTGFAAEPGAGGRERRTVGIDGAPARGQAALAEVVAVAWLVPEMDRLFTDSPSARRRFLDRIVYGVDPQHATRVSAYERAMQQRSVLLRAGGADPGWLAALETAMAAHGVAVAAARVQVAAQLAAMAAETPPPFPRVAVGLRGPVEDWLAAGPALAAEDRMTEALAAARRGDAESGGAGVGPHRSQVVVHHGDSGRAAEDCSTGEQKMLLIALVLQGARLRTRERRSAPLLLLDEVVAHLDERHRRAVFEAIGELGAQAWYAGTDPAPFRPLLGRAQFVAVDEIRRTAGADAEAGGRAGTAESSR